MHTYTTTLEWLEKHDWLIVEHSAVAFVAVSPTGTIVHFDLMMSDGKLYQASYPTTQIEGSVEYFKT